MGLSERAKENGLEELYNQYRKEVEDIERECEEEGYPTNGSNYELRIGNLRRYYQELFDD